jgi:hypothetical protein
MFRKSILTMLVFSVTLVAVNTGKPYPIDMNIQTLGSVPILVVVEGEVSSRHGQSYQR